SSAALLSGPGRGPTRVAVEVGEIPQIGLTTDCLRPGDELPSVRSVDGQVGDAVQALVQELLGRAGPGCFERRFPVALVLLLIGHGWGPPGLERIDTRMAARTGLSSSGCGSGSAGIAASARTTASMGKTVRRPWVWRNCTAALRLQ